MHGTITVVNKYKHIPTPSTIYIGRGSIFGNPFHVSMGRTECIEKYRTDVFIPNMLDTNSAYYIAIKRLLDRVKLGENIYLMCYCAPQACHGDIIKTYIDTLLKP